MAEADVYLDNVQRRDLMMIYTEGGNVSSFRIIQ